MWRCKKLEQMECSVAVLQGVGVQAVVTEYFIKNVDILFTDSAQTGSGDVATGMWNKLVTLLIVIFFYHFI